MVYGRWMNAVQSESHGQRVQGQNTEFDFASLIFDRICNLHCLLDHWTQGSKLLSKQP